ncbi:Ger(x)C family spore germination protein [Paenibacillus sp. LHD-38]|uniref:Ger(x)C family spore germination protein n=1 Tax=Paenibacillus sp. LHD-38 TaxID=3072143 RepID=UPI00280E5D3D|nr:Ger(x)C family spore germination protein [Paenibacillus sp. LHD-38]MDQ8735919.1 Ger(x)C family spore germination protein [Paenibacillus sp. LHD-38]
MASAWLAKRRNFVWKRAALIGLMFSSLLLEGCWDEINLEDVSYISSLGIDYSEGHYIVYAQMIKFGLIAKTETVQPDPSPVWIGKGEGDSILLALNDLTQAGQAILSLEHLKTVVVQERAMFKMRDIMDGLNRQRASRYTSLMFGTRGTIENIFTTDTFFDQSPLNSIMYSPFSLNSQRSFIRPYAMQLAVQTLKEPAMTTTLPALTANKDYWKRKKQPLNIQLYDGIFVYRELDYLGFMTESDASGLRWVNPVFHHYLFEAIGKEGRASVAVDSSKSKVKASIKDGEVDFSLQVSMKGQVDEMRGTLSEAELVASMEDRVKQQIEETYRKGQAKGMDLFQLEHHLYRYHLAYWKQNCKGEDWKPKPNQLKIQVKFNLIHSGNFELGEGT